MRYDTRERYFMIPLKRFTWGYYFDHDHSRWRFYWFLRLPGQHWQYSPAMDNYRWCSMVVGYREGEGMGYDYCRLE